MNIIAIRGATTIKENTKSQILEATSELLQEIIQKNNIKREDIISIFFTATKDISKSYPAIAARDLGITQAALMCMQEMDVDNSLAMCIRVMMQIQKDKTEAKDFKASHLYLHDARKLRPDLVAHHSIAIDGPSGAGKSTIAKRVATSLGWVYVDTGAMYRAVAYYCKEKGIDWNQEEKVKALLDDIDIKIKIKQETQHIYLNQKDITDLIRSQEIAAGASAVATYNEVRKKLVELQRNLALKQSIVMDGRDIGSHVLKDASAKIFLTASASERAMRRFKELEQAGHRINLEEIKQEMIERDYNDSHREFSPLCKAPDASEIDTTGKSIDQVTNEILELIKKLIGRK